MLQEAEGEGEEEGDMAVVVGALAQAQDGRLRGGRGLGEMLAYQGGTVAVGAKGPQLLLQRGPI